MDIETFKKTLQQAAPPADAAPALQALWHQGKGDWERAHRTVQSANDGTGAWVHAHLHRVEGDHSNAAYWYRRAGKPVPSAPVGDEWDEIVSALLDVG